MSTTRRRKGDPPEELQVAEHVRGVSDIGEVPHAAPPVHEGSALDRRIGDERRDHRLGQIRSLGELVRDDEAEPDDEVDLRVGERLVEDPVHSAHRPVGLDEVVGRQRDPELVAQQIQQLDAERLDELLGGGGRAIEEDADVGLGARSGGKAEQDHRHHGERPGDGTGRARGRREDHRSISP